MDGGGDEGRAGGGRPSGKAGGATTGAGGGDVNGGGGSTGLRFDFCGLAAVEMGLLSSNDSPVLSRLERSIFARPLRGTISSTNK